MVVLSQDEIVQFQERVFEGLKGELRDFPWRETHDPYRILVSEVMLQQTQTARVVPKYVNFINEFSNVKALAEASIEQVLRVWQGLGYNRRAKALLLAAQTVVERFGGEIPREKEDLRSLPGVGEYTASAVRVFAFEELDVLVETNIRTVFIAHFFRDEQRVSDRDLKSLVAQTLYASDIRGWFYALMDYGVLLKSQGSLAHRKSQSYRKQSRFVGSVRQARGALLSVLLEGPRSYSDLARGPLGPVALEAALDGLKKDGLIVEDGSGVYKVRSSQLSAS
jgi:A/G-specific adenine glycosylase